MTSRPIGCERVRREAMDLAVASMAALLPWLASGCGEREAAATAQAGEAGQAVPVEVVRASRHPFERSIEVAANVLPERTVGIVGQVPGTIRAMLVEVGDRVADGQVLARLDQRDYLLALRQAQAQAAAARADSDLAAIGVQSAQTQKARMESLRDSNAIAESELEKVDDGYKMGVARQTAAQAQVKLAEVGLAAASTRLGDTVIKAPFAGVVLQRSMDQGAYYHPSSPMPLLLVADDSHMFIEGSVGERDIQSIRAGMPAEVQVDALPDLLLSGTVEIVSPMVDPRTRTAKLRVTVDNADGRLGAGMSARIVLALGAAQVLAVPADALLRSGESTRAELFVVEDGRLARRREVTVGSRLGDLVEVVDGIEEGAEVIRSGGAALDDGDRIEVARERTRTDG